jgi:hypothetical protein
MPRQSFSHWSIGSAPTNAFRYFLLLCSISSLASGYRAHSASYRLFFIKLTSRFNSKFAHTHTHKHAYLNICSFVHQCNTFTSYILLIVDMFWPHTATFRCYSILSTAIFRCYSTLSRSWCSVMPISAYVMLPAMCFSWSCAIVSVRLLEQLCCLCGRHDACLL